MAMKKDPKSWQQINFEVGRLTASTVVGTSADGTVSRRVQFSEIGMEPITYMPFDKYGEPSMRPGTKVWKQSEEAYAKAGLLLDKEAMQKRNAAASKIRAHRGGRRGTVLTGDRDLSDEPTIGSPGLLGA